MPIIQGIAAVGFDLDGTLYSSNEEINNRIRIEISKRILAKKPYLGGIEEARRYFEDRHTVLQSGTKVLKEAGFDDSNLVMDDCLAKADVLDLINYDGELVDILNKLSQVYQIYLVTNSPRELGEKKLERLGINPRVFNPIVYSDNIRGSKQDGAVFRYVLIATQIPANKHVYVGDRKNSDILPAKALGIKTIAVGSVIKEADFSIQSIHEIRRLLL
ncbi:MAG: HAD family hydrolase [Nanoarchaeota archaeon]